MLNVQQLVCHYCGDTFSKESKEIKRRKKKGQERFFCTRSCSVSQSNKETPRVGKTEHLRADNRRDEYTPFRWFMLRVKGRVKKRGPTNLTVEYLQCLWRQQEGRCPLTGWALLLPDNTNGWKSGLKPESASLDRIDPSLGYVEGNVRFVAVMANLARGRFEDSDVLRFAEAVVSST